MASNAKALRPKKKAVDVHLPLISELG